MLLSLVIVMILLLGNTLGASAEDYFELNELDERVDGFYTMKDIKSGETIMRTARIIHPGDEYINSANKLYRVAHDAGAYNRSRRTAEEFLNEGVSALFDIHRDAVPPEEYIATVEGRPTVQLQLVVGRQNQNLQANRDFAEGLKNITDERHPGLIKGIFMARGNYNQDMLPLAMLVEVGSHENTREGAERSIALFSDSVTAYFLGREGDQAREGVGATALKSVLWLVLLAGVALGVYMLISTRNMEELRSKFRGFFKKEFAELGGRKKDGKDGEEEAGE